MIEELNASIKDGVAAYVRHGIQPTFDWNTVAGYISHCADVELGEPIGILNYKLPLADQVDSIKPVKQFLDESLEREILGVDMYATLTTKTDVRYHSKNDVLLWNVLGYSELELYDNVRLLEPGDVLFIPKEAEYKVKPLGHRAFVAFSLK
jgi:mannose-6-phosphate isomerase-like protein (cupin superfamily)